MTWFIDWWNGFDTVQQILLSIAIPSTLILVLQTVLLLFGLGGHGSDVDNGEADLNGIDTDGDGVPDAVDLDGDGIPDVEIDAGHFEAGPSNDVNAFPNGGAHHSSGLKLFSLRGLIAFFAVGSWLGIALIDLGVNTSLSVVLAFAGGFLALLLCALIIKWSLSMQENGTFSARNAIAHTATVYIPIPPERQGTGKVTLTVQERFVECDAMTDEKEKLPTGKQVQVVSVSDKNILIVRSIL